MEEVEELASGPPEQQSRGRRTAWPVLVLAALAVGWFLLPDSPATPAAPPPAVSPSPGPGYQPGFHEAVPTLESICTPVTDGHKRLSIRFVIINRNAEHVAINDVIPSTPLGGLRPDRVRVVKGGCRAPLDEKLETPLDSGAEALVVMDFTLPPECPQPYPVGATVTSSVPDVSRSTTDTHLALYPDLGSVRFASCAGVG